MRVVTELSFFLENKSGVLAAVCKNLREEGVNLEAISVVDHIDHAIVRMVVPKPAKATAVLAARDLPVITKEVLQIDLTNRPGALEDVARRLARARVNIDYLYGTVGIATRARLYLRVNDLKKARRALER
ncbi:MAG: hypothetical protein QOD06_1550 [Candidatus Binatota bacterium]|jgi:hypothetical protein|nr:hypothetical protein [Candidatus Binatota bacterium]